MLSESVSSSSIYEYILAKSKHSSDSSVFNIYSILNYIPADLTFFSDRNLKNTCFGLNPLYSENNEDPDEMQHNAAFHKGLHCL